MNKHIRVAAAAALMASLGLAWAGDGGGGQPGAGDGKGPRMLDRGDTDRDGKVSREEFKALHEKRMEEMFRALDASGDGFIDEAELRRAREASRERMQKRQGGERAPQP